MDALAEQGLIRLPGPSSWCYSKLILRLLVSRQILQTEQRITFAQLLAAEPKKSYHAYKRYIARMLPYEMNLYYSHKDTIHHLIKRYKEIYGDSANAQVS